MKKNCWIWAVIITLFVCGVIAVEKGNIVLGIILLLWGNNVEHTTRYHKG